MINYKLLKTKDGVHYRDANAYTGRAIDRTDCGNVIYSLLAGKLHGEVTCYFPDTTRVRSIDSYRFGMKHGTHIDYEISGFAKYIAHFIEDKMQGNCFHLKEGRIFLIETFSNSIHDDPYLLFNDDGTIVRGELIHGERK